MIKLGEIVDVKSGKRLPKNSNFTNKKTDHPYIKISNIDDNIS
jgi:type I restriction enzyme S subunit